MVCIFYFSLFFILFQCVVSTLRLKHCVTGLLCKFDIIKRLMIIFTRVFNCTWCIRWSDMRERKREDLILFQFFFGFPCLSLQCPTFFFFQQLNRLKTSNPLSLFLFILAVNTKFAQKVKLHVYWVLSGSSMDCFTKLLWIGNFEH